jgi:hypothetical protein
MAEQLEAIFRGLDLTIYLDAFVKQGFDTWEIVCDVQDSDL